MKPKHTQRYRQSAIATFEWLHVSPDQDFHVLSSEQVGKVLIAADEAHYRKPKNANGSRARYFYQRLQRHARLPRE